MRKELTTLVLVSALGLLTPRGPVPLHGPIEPFDHSRRTVIVLNGAAYAGGPERLPFVGDIPFDPSAPLAKPFFGTRPPVEENISPYFGSRPRIQPPTDPTTQQVPQRQR